MLKMGKLTILTSLLFLTFFHANAQTETENSTTNSSPEVQVKEESSEASSEDSEYVYSKFGYGITLGGTASTFDLHSGYRFGLVAGIYGSYSIFDGFNVRAEALYFQNGGNKPDETRTFGSGSDSFTQTVRDRSVLLHNVLVPVMLTYEFPVGNTAPFIGAGGSYQFNFAAQESAKRTYDVTGGDVSTSPAQWQNVSDQYQRHTWGLIFSLGVKIPEVVNDYSMRVEARYNLGMRDINASYLNSEAQNGSELKSNSFMLTISFGY